MERLVSKEQLEMALKIIATTPRELVEDIYLKNAKLGQLENIEEELGIGLMTLFRLLKNDGWICNRTRSGLPYNIVKCDFELGKESDGSLGFGIGIPLKEYGYRIALSREELERK